MRTVDYGALELKESYQKNMATGIAIAGLGMLILMSSFLIYNFIVARAQSAIPVVHIRTISELAPPPSLSTMKNQAMAVASPNVAPPKVGVPKAVPDEKAPQEQEFATQKDLSAIQNLSAKDLLGSGSGESLAIDIPSDEYLPSSDQFVPYDEPPKFIKKVQPKYPQLARLSGVTGTVYVQVLVDKSGKVRDVKISKDSGTNAGLEEAAIEAAKASEFTPAISNNQPIALWIIYRYDFKL
jgi:TonB family protein